MVMRFQRFIVFLFLVLCFSVAIFAQEYFKLTQAVTIEASEALPDQQTQNLVATMSISPLGVKIDYGNDVVLLYIDAESKFYILYPERKEYSNLVMETINPFITSLNESMGGFEVKATQTKREEKVVDWDSVIWTVIASGEKFEMDIEIGIATDWEDIPILNRFYTAMMKYQGNRGAITKEILKAKGLSLKTDTAITMEGQLLTKSVITIEIDEEIIPDTEFQLPAGYTEVQLSEEVFKQVFM
jgi:hypothetical protein